MAYKKADLGDIFKFKGEIVEVQWINPGRRAIGMVPVNAVECPCCGEIKSWEVIEESEVFQEGAEAVQTLKKK